MGPLELLPFAKIGNTPAGGLDKILLTAPAKIIAGAAATPIVKTVVIYKH